MKYISYISRFHRKRVVLIALDRCGNSTQIKTYGTQTGTLGRNRTISFTPGAPTKTNPHDSYPGKYNSLPPTRYFESIFDVNYSFDQPLYLINRQWCYNC